MTQIEAELKDKRVLIVDDEPEVASTLKEQLESVGMRVVGIARNGGDAVKMTDELDPSLVIMDILLDREGGMDGIETAKRIIEKEPRPILLLSGHADAEYIMRAKDVGLNSFVVKPVSLEALIPQIILTMSGERRRIMLIAELEEIRETLANRKVIDQAKGLLMKKRSLDEEAAYAFLRKKSQDQNKPMAEIARMVLVMQDLL